MNTVDWIAGALLLVGVLCVATGALPRGEAGTVVLRIAPLLVFLAAVIVLAELTAFAGVFEVIAARVAIAGRGNYTVLFVLCVAFATATTSVLNLDTTAVLLTPVMLALAAKVGIATVPLAMTTVWLANTASLLLPVSNLTNLLAQDRIGLSPVAFAGRMWVAEVVSVAATMACLWLFYWRRSRRGADRYRPPEPHQVADPVLFWVASAACAAFVAAILLADAPLWAASTGCAAVVVTAFAVRRRDRLRPKLFPLRLLVMVTGLFLVVQTISNHGLAELMLALVGGQDGTLGMYRAAAAGGALSNLVNNLPAYAAGEAAIPAGNHNQLLALLVGTNIGPVITPWASLATLLWYERCHAAGVDIPVRRFAGTGAVLAVTGLAVTVLALSVTR